MAIIDHYLWFLHLDRRMSLDIDLGPLHIHLYSRAVFLMWVTVAILALGRHRGARLPQARTDTEVAHLGADRPGRRLPVWLGAGTTAALAATLAVVAVIEYARLVQLARADTCVLWRWPCCTRSRPGCARRCCSSRPSSCCCVRCPRCSGVTSKTAPSEALSPHSDRCGSAGRCHTS